MHLPRTRGNNKELFTCGHHLLFPISSASLPAKPIPNIFLFPPFSFPSYLPLHPLRSLIQILQHPFQCFTNSTRIFRRLDQMVGYWERKILGKFLIIRLKREVWFNSIVPDPQVSRSFSNRAGISNDGIKILEVQSLVEKSKEPDKVS